MSRTHGDNICPGVVHALVVFGRPFYADVSPRFYTRVWFPQKFPSSHEELEGWDSTAQLRLGFTWHMLLDLEGNLLNWSLSLHLITVHTDNWMYPKDTFEVLKDLPLDWW